MARPLFVKPQNNNNWYSSSAQYVKDNSTWEKGLLWVKVNGVWEHDHEFTEYVQIQTPTCIKQNIYAYQCICKLDGSMSEYSYGSVDLSNHDSSAERIFSKTVNTSSTQHTKQYNCKACGIYDSSWDSLENHTPVEPWTYDTTYHWHKCTEVSSGCDAELEKVEHDDVTISYGLNPDDTEEQQDERHWRVRNCWTCNLAEYSENEPHSLTSSYEPYMDLTHLTTTWCTGCGHYTKENEEEGHSFIMDANQGYEFDYDAHWKTCLQCEGRGNTYDFHVNSGYLPDPGNNALGHYAYCTTCNYLISPTQDHYGPFQESSDGISHYKNCELCGYAIVPSESHTEDTSFWNTDSSDHWRSCKVCTFEMEHTKVAHNGSWSTNSTSHWMNCSTCDYEMVAAAAHTSDWERDGTQHWKYCDTCNYTMVSPTSHDFSGWATTENYHWRKCSTCDPNGEAYLDYAAHVEPSTWTTDSAKHYKYCSTGCGYLLKSGAHTGSAEWSTDATYHWHDCTTCGYDVDKAKHTTPSVWSDYDTSKHYKYCDGGCGYTVVSGSHTASSTWSTDSNYHWHWCSVGCGYAMDKDVHSLPSYWSEGDDTYHYKYCLGGCGYVMASGLHTASSTWSTNSSYHWHECSSGCGYDMNKGSHSGSWSYYNDSYHRKLCDTCDYTINGLTAHDAVGSWTYSGNYHWKTCSTCQGQLYYGTHTTPTTWEHNVNYHYKYCADGCGKLLEREAHNSGSYEYDEYNHWKNCSECGYTMEPTTAHSGSWSTNATSHWKNCSTCGYEMVSPEDHSLSLSSSDDTYEYYSCECGYSTSSTHSTSYTGWYVTLGTYHTQQCSNSSCGTSPLHEAGTRPDICQLCYQSQKG